MSHIPPILCVCRAHLDKLLEYVEISVKEGARLVYGGNRVNRPGEVEDMATLCYYYLLQGFLWSPLSWLMWKTTQWLHKRSHLVQS